MEYPRLSFDQSFFEPEVRSGYLITEKQKRIWAVQLSLSVLLDQICTKYEIPYFMDFGTMLGAARHKGFVPWDIDMDFCMMRKDYDRFLKAAPQEMPEHISFQSDFLHYDMVKIRDDRTSAVHLPNLSPSVSQGIFIDVAPLDDVTDGPGFPDISEMQREILLIMHNPELMLEYVKNRQGTVLPMDFILELLKADPAEVQAEFDAFCLQHAGKSSLVANIYSYISWGGKRKRSWYDSSVMLPFEQFQFPAPIGWEEFLRAQYGDYEKEIRRESIAEEAVWDPDVCYTEYLSGGPRFDRDFWVKLNRLSPEGSGPTEAPPG